MAYAALNSLLQTIEKTPQPAQQIITSFKEKVARLLVILEDSSPKNNLTISNFEAQIRDASYDAEDLIESYMLNRSKVLSKFVSAVTSCFQWMISSQTVDQEFQGLEKTMKEFDSILEALSQMNDAKVEDDLQPCNSFGAAGPSRPVGTSTRKSTDLVGLDEDLLQLKDRLTGQPCELDIISIVGMGGIGKTTLVRNLYNDSLIQHRFDTRAWTVVSQEYNVREMLRRLLDTTRDGGGNKLHEKSAEKLAELLYKSLKGKRYFVVIDDVWETKAWDDVRRCFPDDNNGSRIILTTRLSEVATYINSSRSIHHMNLLSLTSSWNLLCKLVFGEEKCPSPLEEVGMRIANSCKGLPLAITVVGGLLSKGSKMPGYWEHVAQNVKSSITENDDQFMEILSFSYKYLPPHLKACFLYIGGFPEDHIIFVSQLIKLWVAEGFIKPLTSKSLEDVAEDYLKDLIERNLIMVHKRKHNGGVKTCIIHDMLRGLCIKKARDEKFLQIMNWGAQISREGKHIHSLLYTSKCHSNGTLPFTTSVRMLRVLDALGISFSMFPGEIVGLVHLRYLAFVQGFSNTKFPTTISKLQNLQTLIVYGGGYDLLYLPLNIWEMPQLRHILFDLCFLPYPFTEEGTRKYSNDLENLQTLSEVRNFRCTRKICEILPNLKKLGLSYVNYTDNEWSSFEFNSFAYLYQLETLKIRFIDVNPPSPVNFAFPPTLKKLTLSGCKVPWEKMSIIGLLPNLEVLKLRNYAFEGSVWEPNEGEFSKLKFLLISDTYMRQWRASNTHFPCLQHLYLNHCPSLEEIPSEIGEIATLEMIELINCSPSSVASARLIQEEQQSLDNNDLKLNVRYSRDYHKYVKEYTSLRKEHRYMGSPPSWLCSLILQYIWDHLLFPRSSLPE